MFKSLSRITRWKFLVLSVFFGLAVSVMQVQAATTYNADSGVLSVSTVEIDHNGTPYSVTLQLSGPPGIPVIGSEFTMQEATPNNAEELRYASYTTASGMLYLPEVQIITQNGVLNYRMLLELSAGSSESLSLKVVSLAENGTASYNTETGELYVPVVDIDEGLNSVVHDHVEFYRGRI